MLFTLALACVLACGCEHAFAFPPEFESATTPEQFLKIGKSWMRDSTEQEMSELRRLLYARRNLIPNGVKVFDQISRDVHPERRLNGQPASSCYNYKTEATCSGSTNEECIPCEWSWSSCQEKGCSSYQNQSSCCANSLNIWHGCYWLPQQQDGGSAICVDQKCDAIADTWRMCSSFSSTCPAVETACGQVQGCTSTCAGCKVSGTTCECTDGGSMCQAGEGEGEMDMDAMMGAMSAMQCPTMDCVMCMKDGVDWDDQMTENMANKWDNACAARCEQIVHCKEEALCLADGSGSASAAQAGSCTATPFPSCASDITTFTTTTPATAQETCPESCARFDQECAASCGASHSCTGNDSSIAVSRNPTQWLASCVVAIAAFGM